MRNTFYALVNTFAKQNNCLCTLKEGTCQGTLTVEGIDIHVGFQEESGMLILQSGVGLLPPDHREALYCMLLSANNFFHETSGLTLGLDTAQELITLQCVWDLRHLDDEHFAILMENFLTLLAQWLHKLAIWTPDDNPVGTEQNGDDTLLMGQFLRV